MAGGARRQRLSAEAPGAAVSSCAAHALAEGAVLATNNEAEFGRVEGLPIETWVR
jgi:predicted nucleic acid-binding protein